MSHPNIRLGKSISGPLALVLLGCTVVSCSSERPAISSQACAVDTIAAAGVELLAAPAGTRLTIKGWAADPLGKRVGKEVIVRLVNQSGDIVASGTRSDTIQRPDVAAYLKIPGLEASGFHADVETRGLPAGTLEIMIESRFETHSVACRGNRVVTLT